MVIKQHICARTVGVMLQDITLASQVIASAVVSGVSCGPTAYVSKKFLCLQIFCWKADTHLSYVKYNIQTNWAIFAIWCAICTLGSTWNSIAALWSINLSFPKFGGILIDYTFLWLAEKRSMPSQILQWIVSCVQPTPEVVLTFRLCWHYILYLQQFGVQLQNPALM